VCGAPLAVNVATTAKLGPSSRVRVASSKIVTAPVCLVVGESGLRPMHPNREPILQLWCLSKRGN
jgi:hypothetical protein